MLILRRKSNTVILIPIAMSTLKPFALDRKIFNRQLFSQILELWFTDLPRTSVAPSQQQILKWFGAGDQSTRQAFDNACRSEARTPLSLLGPATVNLPKFTTFENDRANAISIASPFLDLDELKTDDVNARAEAALGLILLLDQFSRNIFRDRQELIYSHYDRLAQALARCILSSEGKNGMSSIDTISFCRLCPPYRIWLYMPLMHSEDLRDHEDFDRAVSDMRHQQQGNADAVEYLDGIVKFESKHRRILEEFRRYPHRNAILGREPTPAEEKWLEEGGDTFGTG